MVMAFVLNNALVTFQRVIDDALGDLRFSCVIVYVDGILVHYPDKQTHAQDLFKMVPVIHAAGLFIKPRKREFFRERSHV